MESIYQVWTGNTLPCISGSSWIWLVIEPPLWNKQVSWDDEIPFPTELKNLKSQSHVPVTSGWCYPMVQLITFEEPWNYPWMPTTCPPGPRGPRRHRTPGAGPDAPCCGRWGIPQNRSRSIGNSPEGSKKYEIQVDFTLNLDCYGISVGFHGIDLKVFHRKQHLSMHAEMVDFALPCLIAKGYMYVGNPAQMGKHKKAGGNLWAAAHKLRKHHRSTFGNTFWHHLWKYYK